MAEDDIRKYLSGRAGDVTPRPRQPRMVVREKRRRPPVTESFSSFGASHMLCPRCRRATPVREKLLLYLSDGDLYGYLCSVCGTSVGTRKAGR